MNADLDSKIKAKGIELERAQKIVKKYTAPVPLSVAEAIGHDGNQMKTDQDNRNKLRDEHRSLLRQRSNEYARAKNCF